MIRGRKLQLKTRILRGIAWVLLLTIIANIANAFILPKKARAADPSMMLFWDTALGGAGPPAGWTFVDDGAGEAFYNGGGTNNVFPRGEATYGAVAGGAYNHTHTATPTSPSGAASGGTSRSASTTQGTVSTYTHVHTVSGSASLTSVDNRPAYRNLRVIKYSGIPTTIPQYAIAVFDAAVPSGWTSFYATQGTNYVAGLSTSGGTGGSNSHGGAGHTVSGLTLDNNSGTSTSTISGSTSNRNTVIHTHTACSSSNVTNAPASEPPYINVVLGSANANTSIPNGMIAMFDGSIAGPSYGWEVLSNNGGPFYQKFLKSASSYSAGAGADPTHTHTNVSCASSSVTGSAAGGSGTAGYGISGSHTHTTTVTINAATGSTLPTYTNVIFAKSSYKFNSLTTDSGSYPSLGQTITMNSTVANNSSTNLTNTVIDYVIFIDGNANNAPDAGETYITANCAGSGAWAATNYTWQTTSLNVNANSTANDTDNCANSNFPSDTIYVLYGKWYANGGSPIYATAYTTFTSIPTLTGILFMALAGCGIFLTVKTGTIKLKPKNPDDHNSSDSPPYPNHQGESQRSNDGISYKRDKINE